MATDTLMFPGVAVSGPAQRAAVDVSCAHCSLPVPAGLIESGAERQFCCHGCRTAHDIIHGCGLERYYRIREASEAAPSRGTGGGYGQFDDPVFQGLYCRNLEGGLVETELRLEGVHCAACVWLVEKLPAVCAGVVESRLDLRRALVRVVWDPARTRLSAVGRMLDSLGYAPHPARDASARSLRRVEDRKHLVRLAVAGACAGNVMLLALALYAGVFDAMDPEYSVLFRWTSMLISVVSLVWPGSVFYRGAVAALRTRTVHLDIPIALGLLAGGIWSVVSTIRGEGEIYFDSLSVLVFALLVGRFIQHRQQRWSSDAVELLFSLTPSSARLVAESGEVREVPIEAISAGDTVEVLAGGSIPVDGIIARGRSTVDQSLLTGESRPVAVGEGDDVSAGAVNLSERLLVRVAATGEDTRVGRLMRIVEQSAQNRAPIVRMADRIAGVFVVCMIVLATLTIAVWLFIEPSQALAHAAALLIVTCPCALGLATPLAVTVAIGRAARRSILIKGGDPLEQLSRPGTIFIDKTGTITEGRTALVRWHGDDSARVLAAALESTSSHPIARAIAGAVTDTAVPAPEEAVETIGRGIEGRVLGRRTAVGSPSYIRSLCPQTPDWLDETERRILADGLTPVLIAVDGGIVAAAALGDPVRADAAASIAALRRLGWRVGILSGDHPELAVAVGRTLGIDAEDARGGMTPEDKLAAVETARRCTAGPVVMVGDGVNDAAALAAATVGVAVHGGAEASLNAADVYLNRPGLDPILELVTGSRRTLNVIRRNLAASLFYNISAATLAVLGMINPLVAAIIMPASSLTVLTLSYRSRTFGGR